MMDAPSSSSIDCRKIWLWASLALTAVIVTLHVNNMMQAGPLWRDEAGTISFATMPTWADIWRNLRYDNFPPLFLLIARTWSNLFSASDFSFRVLGFIIGLGGVGAAWFCARTMNCAAPFAALAVFAVNPVAVRFCDSMRSYGIGVMTIFLAAGLMWKFLQAPTAKRFILAAAGATLAVQSLYQNCWFVLAISVGAAAVAFARDEKKLVMKILCVGGIAAVSLLPYLGNILKAREWADVPARAVTVEQMSDATRDFFGVEGDWTMGIWVCVIVAGAAAVYYAIRRHNPLVLFAGMIVAVGTTFYLVFLHSLKMTPHPWYFLLLAAMMSVMIEPILSALPSGAGCGTRALLAVLCCFALPTAIHRTGWRATNVDCIAATLREEEQPGDVIVLTNWYLCVALHRYFDGLKWEMVPPIADRSILRYDLFKQAAREPSDPFQPVLAQIKTALQSGHRLWMIGAYYRPPAGYKLPPFKPASAQTELMEAVYSQYWTSEISTFLFDHATMGTTVPVFVPRGQAVDPLEHLPLLNFSGWKD